MQKGSQLSLMFRFSKKSVLLRVGKQKRRVRVWPWIPSTSYAYRESCY